MKTSDTQPDIGSTTKPKKKEIPDFVKMAKILKKSLDYDKITDPDLKAKIAFYFWIGICHGAKLSKNKDLEQRFAIQAEHVILHAGWSGVESMARNFDR